MISFLLARNTDLIFGNWQVKVNDRGLAAFVLEYSALAEALTAPLLKHIASRMIPEVVAFDTRMQQAGLLRLQ